MFKKLFYTLPDRFVVKTDARQRRAINFWLLMIWIVPGLPIWIIERNAIWFIGFMSIYAIWASHFGAFSAETPVEHEDEPE